MANGKRTENVDELKAKRAAEARTTSGNSIASRLRGAFQTGRKKVRGAANVLGQFTKAATTEASGLLREFGRGITGREATPAGGGPAKAAGGAKATGAQQAVSRLAGRAAPGIDLGIPRGLVQTPGGGAGLGGVARTLGRGLGPAGVGLAQAGDILTESIGSLPARFLRTNPITAGPTLAIETALRRGRGDTALESVVEPALAGLEAASGGLVGRRGVRVGEESPLNITGPTASQTPLQLGAQAAGLAPAPGAPAAPAAPAAGLRAAQFGEEGERAFEGADATAALTDRSPEAIASRRGTASVEENQEVLDRLLARNQGLRAAGAPAAPGAPGAPGGRESSDLLNRLGSQAAAGGLASAFGALNVGGNVLRREAADRTRANEAQVAATDASNDLNLALTKIAAQSAVDTKKNATKDAVGLTESVNKAIESRDPEQVANVRSAIFQSFQQNPKNPATRAAMSNLIAEDIRNNTESSFFGAFFNPFGAGRGPLDLLKSGGQGGFNNDFQDAINKVVLNTSTRKIEIANPDGSGERQFLANIDDLQPETRQALFDFGLQTEGAGQPVTRGQGLRGDPNVPAGT